LAHILSVHDDKLFVVVLLQQLQEIAVANFISWGFYYLNREFRCSFLHMDHCYMSDQICICATFPFLNWFSLSKRLACANPAFYPNFWLVLRIKGLTMFFLFKHILKTLKFKRGVNCWVSVKLLNFFEGFFKKLFLPLHRFNLCLPKTAINIWKGSENFEDLFVDFLLINDDKRFGSFAKLLVFFENLRIWYLFGYVSISHDCSKDSPNFVCSLFLDILDKKNSRFDLFVYFYEFIL
jgi:hypothetical protein